MTTIIWTPVDKDTPVQLLPALDHPVLVSRRRQPGGREAFDYVDLDFRSTRFNNRWAYTDSLEHVTAWAPKPAPYGIPASDSAGALLAHLAAHHGAARPADGDLCAWALAALQEQAK